MRADYDAAYRLAKDIAVAAPASEWRYELAESANAVGRAHEALRVLDDIGPDLGFVKDFVPYWSALGVALHLTGQHERELAAMDEACRRFPTDRFLSQMRTKALAALGREADVDAEVDRALALRQHMGWPDAQPMYQAITELRAHGHRDAARRLASRTLTWIRGLPPDERRRIEGSVGALLVESGDLNAARRYFEAQNAAHPEDPDLSDLALIAAEQGDRTTALKLDAQITRSATHDTQWDVNMTRAAIAALLGDRETAVRLIRDAMRNGLALWRPLLHFEYSFASLRGYPPFDALAGPID
jgi:tetratricopeptide (TPR) repeat protein